jgi:hypothetical protein
MCVQHLDEVFQNQVYYTMVALFIQQLELRDMLP